MRQSLSCLLLLLTGCNGTMVIAGLLPEADDDSAEPDDDSTAGDDDSMASDDDTSTSGDDDTTPDEDVLPTVDCGPFEEPGPDFQGQSVSIWSGAADNFEDGDSWAWRGCEAERVFGPSGQLRCENLYEVAGYLYRWEEPDAWYALEFTWDPQGSTCDQSGDSSLNYRVRFGETEVDVSYLQQKWGQGEYLGSGPYEWTGEASVFLEYVSEPWAN